MIPFMMKRVVVRTLLGAKTNALLPSLTAVRRTFSTDGEKGISISDITSIQPPPAGKLMTYK